MDRYLDGVLHTDETTFEAVPDDVVNANLMDANRGLRDLLLRESDWTQMPDSPLTSPQKTAWSTYRQALRDITAHENWPNLADEDWPAKPS